MDISITDTTSFTLDSSSPIDFTFKSVAQNQMITAEAVLSSGSMVVDIISYNLVLPNTFDIEFTGSLNITSTELNLNNLTQIKIF